MRALISTLLVVGLIVLMVANPLFARFDSWDSENGVMIRQGHHVFWEGKAMATDGNDNWLIAWADGHNGTQDVYAQLYDSDGNELWPSGGLRITDGPYPEEMPILAYAGNDEWIIGWQDYRLDIQYQGRMTVYAQKYNSRGQALWTDGGVFIGPDGGNQIEGKSQKPPTIHPTTDGGAICVYESGLNSHDPRYFAQRLSSDGGLLWGDRGVALNDRDGRITATSDGSDGLFYILSQTGRVGVYNLIVNHLSSDGEQTWGEDLSGLPLEDLDIFGHNPKITVDGDGGAFVCWKQSTPQNAQSVYGQHITIDGELNWGEFGTELTMRGDHSLNYQMINSAPREIEIVWSDNETPVFAQRIEASGGQPVLLWGEEGEELEGIRVSEYMEHPYLMSIYSDQKGGLVTTWIERNESGYRDFRIQRVSVDGEMAWDEAGTIRVREKHCSSQKVVTLGDRIFFAWRETKSSEFGLSFQAYNMGNGSTLMDEYSVPIVMGISNQTTSPKIIKSGESAYVSWIDGRNFTFGDMPYIQRVDLETGEPQWEHQGKKLAPTYFEDNEPSHIRMYGAVQIVEDQSGGAINVWTKRHIVSQRINEDGSLEWGNSGIAMFGEGEFDFESSARNQKLFSDDEGGAVLVVEIRKHVDEGRQIRMQRINSNGQVLLGEQGVRVMASAGDRHSLSMKAIRLSDGDFLITWQRDMRLQAIKIDRDGTPIWDSPVTLKEFGERYADYSVAEIQNSIVVTYRDVDGDSQQTYMVYLNQDGEKVHDQYDLALDNFDDSRQLKSFYSDSNTGWMTYLTGTELYLTKVEIAGDGPQVDEERTQLISDCENERVYSNIVEDGNGGVFVFWTEGYTDMNIRYKHFNGNVEPVCEEYVDDGVVLVDSRYNQSQMCMVPDGEGGVLTAWNDWRASTGHQEGDDVYIMRVDDGYSLSVTDRPSNESMPGLWSLASAYPNPFNSTTKISFTNPVRAELKVTIFDALGREVTSLANGVHSAGNHTLNWNSNDSFGRPVVSGMYFYEIQGEGVQMTNKVFLVR